MSSPRYYRASTPAHAFASSLRSALLSLPVASAGGGSAPLERRRPTLTVARRSMEWRHPVSGLDCCLLIVVSLCYAFVLICLCVCFVLCGLEWVGLAFVG